MTTQPRPNLIFNKTVSLRESKLKNPQNQTPINAPELKPIDAIKKLGKKYIKLSEDKKKIAKQQLLTLSQELALSDLAPLFLTAVKKRGTRAVTLICLSALKSRGVSFSAEAKGFITKAAADKELWLQALSNKLID